MKKSISKIIALILVLSLALCSMGIGASALTPTEERHLKFNSDGKFTILNLSDFQDGALGNPLTNDFIEKSIEKYKPDLIVLTGDNIAGYRCPTKLQAKAAVDSFMKVFEKMGVPVAIVFGNHDSQNSVSRETQMKWYESYSCNISYDEGDSIDGVGTYNVPIYSSDGSDKVSFNLFMFDSGANDEVNGGYDHLKQNQIDWYKQTSEKLNEENGGTVYSIAFQHIIVKEIYDALKVTDHDGDNTIKSKGVYYTLPDDAAAGSTLGEAPMPGTINSGEYQAFLDEGNVLATVSGHDHVNSFVIPYKGIDIINTPTSGMGSYGNKATRGGRVFVLDENNPQNYETYTYTFAELYKSNGFVSFLLDLREFYDNFINFFKDLFYKVTGSGGF